jgi:fructose-1-phosphate kinase PfkB-like protein
MAWVTAYPGIEPRSLAQEASVLTTTPAVEGEGKLEELKETRSNRTDQEGRGGGGVGVGASMTDSRLNEEVLPD